MKSRTLFRTSIVVLAAAMVIGVTWARSMPVDTTRELMEQAADAKGQSPAPGVEAALRKAIVQPPRLVPRPGTDLTHLGPFQSITYLGASPAILRPVLGQIDSFLVTYRNGRLVWRLSLGKNGKPDRLVYFDPAPMTPQQTIALFSVLPSPQFVVPLFGQLITLFVFAVIGRFVLRIRL